MQITVFGASGKVGSLVVEEALKRGYTVVAFVHSHNPFSQNSELIIRKGDIYNAADVAKALQGSDAVISCLGSWGAPQRNVLSVAMQNIIPAMMSQKIKRVVTLTGIGVQEKPNRTLSYLLDLLNRLPVTKIFRDAEEHLRLLAQSNLNWTVLCSPVMNNFGGADYCLSQGIGFPAATVSRKSVATALLDQIDDITYLRKTPVIHRK